MSRKFVCLLCLLVPAVACANATIDFEGPANGAQVANFYAGVTFINAVDLKVGQGLSPLYPPYSGISVAVDEPQDPMTIVFATPVKFVGAIFTYFAQVNLTYYDAGSNQIGFQQSKCDPLIGCQNFLDSGFSIPPNLWIPFFSPKDPIAKVVLNTGFMGGDLFALDNLLYGDTNVTTIPEPGTLPLTAGAVVLVRKIVAVRLRAWF